MKNCILALALLCCLSLASGAAITKLSDDLVSYNGKLYPILTFRQNPNCAKISATGYLCPPNTGALSFREKSDLQTVKNHLQNAIITENVRKVRQAWANKYQKPICGIQPEKAKEALA